MSRANAYVIAKRLLENDLLFSSWFVAQGLFIFWFVAQGLFMYVPLEDMAISYQTFM